MDDWNGIRVGDRVRFLPSRSARIGSFVVVELRGNDLLGSGSETAIALIDDGDGNLSEVSATMLTRDDRRT